MVPVQLARLGALQRSAAAVLVIAMSIAGCGSSKKTATPTRLALSISETGKSSQYTGPASVKGGLVTVQLTNSGSTPHGAQLLLLLGGHTIPQAEVALGGESGKVPSWLRFEGGVIAAAPGSSASATLSLPAGSYAVADFAGSEAAHGQGGQPAVAPLTVTSGQAGALPATGTTITAAAPSKDHYKWEISGPLKVGANAVTFASKGSQAIHELTAVRITGNHSTAQLVKALESGGRGRPPSFVDPGTKVDTTALDGGKSLTTQFTLSKPGTYVFFCHLSDRNGGKPHFAEGLITTVTVK